VVFEKKRRHLARYIEIGRILARHQFEHLMTQLGLADVFHLRHRGRGLLPDPTDVRESLEELGPTFIKLGQLLSTRTELLPALYIKELQKLQDTAPAVPTPEVLSVIEEELGSPAQRLFAEFSEEPLAAASLGQTHAGRLKDGTKVVVKVQRPGVDKIIETDVEIMQGIAHFLEHHSARLRDYDIVQLVEEFAVTIRRELDYTYEGRNTDKIRENLSNLNFVVVPRVFWEYTTPRVLTIERISGIKVTDIRGMEELGIDRKSVAHNLTNAFMEMIFIHGFFHADPHPGNLVVLDGNTIGLLDFGMVGRLDRRLKTGLTILLAEYVQEDSGGFAEELLRIGSWGEDLNRRAFEADIDRALRPYFGAPLKDVRLGELLRNAFQISARHRVRLPSSLALLVKVLVNIDGIDRQLDPEFDFASEAKPYVKRSMREVFSLQTLFSQAYRSLVQLRDLLIAFPDRTYDLLERLVEGSLRINFRHLGLESAIRAVERAANRLSLALITSATIVASALLMAAKIGPSWNGYPIMGLAGFGLSFLFAVWLIIFTLRSGKL